METLMLLLAVCIGLIIGVAAGFFLRKRFAEGKIGAAEESSKKILAEAQKQAVQDRDNGEMGDGRSWNNPRGADHASLRYSVGA